MFAPHTVKQEYGVTLDDIDIEKYYEELVANPNVLKRKKMHENVEYDCSNTIAIRLSIFNV